MFLCIIGGQWRVFLCIIGEQWRDPEFLYTSKILKLKFNCFTAHQFVALSNVHNVVHYTHTMSCCSTHVQEIKNYHIPHVIAMYPCKVSYNLLQGLANNYTEELHQPNS